VVAIDHGQEFKKGLDTELASLNVPLEATEPYVKGTTAVAETSVRLLKRAMKKACLYNPSSWSDNLPLIVNSLYNSLLYNKTTRNQIYYSPIHYSNRLNAMGFQDMPELMFDEQWNSLQQIMTTRKQQLQLSSTRNITTFKPNQLVTDHQVPQKHQGTSAELEPSVHGVFRIKEVMPKRLRVVNVISGEERTLPLELVRPINLDHLIQMKFSLQNAYINSHFNWLMQANKYLGPDEKKTWRNLAGNQPSLHVAQPARKDASAQDHYTQETTTSTELTYDPDCPTKRTRSGHVYHTVCDLHKPIIRQSTQQSTSADDFLQLTPSALTALQTGLKTSQHKLSVLEQQDLRLGPPDLYPTNKLAWRDPSPR
jgi:hypothetical protein